VRAFLPRVDIRRLGIRRLGAGQARRPRRTDARKGRCIGGMIEGRTRSTPCTIQVIGTDDMLVQMQKIASALLRMAFVVFSTQLLHLPHCPLPLSMSPPNALTQWLTRYKPNVIGFCASIFINLLVFLIKNSLPVHER
jgi:hypothetical protein